MTVVPFILVVQINVYLATSCAEEKVLEFFRLEIGDVAELPGCSVVVQVLGVIHYKHGEGHLNMRNMILILYRIRKCTFTAIDCETCKLIVYKTAKNLLFLTIMYCQLLI